MHYNEEYPDYDTRPLLPTDEDELNSQIKRKIQAENKQREKLYEKHSFISFDPALNNLKNESTTNGLKWSKRSTSNRNMNDLLYVSKNKTGPTKALTNTDNFIEIIDTNNHSREITPEALEKNNGSQEYYSVDNNSDNDEQNSLGSLDNTKTTTMGPKRRPPPIPTSLPSPPEETEVKRSIKDYKSNKDSGQKEIVNAREDEQEEETEEGMSIDPSLKKKRDEWAERGAAKIIKEVTNPTTGEKVKKVIKKGIKDFKFGEMIGDGAYSTVMMATSNESGKKYAVKVLNKEYLIRQKKVKYVNIEKSALQRVNNSSSIIKLFFTFQDETSLYFLLEYAPNGDFLSLLKKYGSINENAACYYSAQIIDAIGFLHSKGIVHRDIKPENILLDSDWKVKLTDFGTAKILEKQEVTSKYDLLTRSKSFVGTAEYVSPELLNDSYVDYRCDIWAFGCILFQMIAGKPPFKATNEYLTFQKVMKVQYAFTAGFPTIIRDLVKRILIKQIDQRLNIPQIQRHHFYRDVNFKDGSIWTQEPPELSAYKISAKSMQPIPALKGPMIYKRPPTPSSKKTVVTPGISISSAKDTNIHIVSSSSSTVMNSSTNNSHSISPSPATNLQTSSTSTTTDAERYQRKTTDERTAAILENARRTVDSRKQHMNRRTPSSSSYISVNTPSRKSPDPLLPSSTTTSSNSPSNSHHNSLKLGHRNAIPSTEVNSKLSKVVATSTSGDTKRSIKLEPRSNSNPGPQKHKNTPNTTRSINMNSAIDASPVVKEKSSSRPLTPSSNISHNPGTPGPNKLDVQWSFYLKSIEEHILKGHEMYISVIDSDLLEKKLSHTNRALTVPNEFDSGRSTLLSQVARNGGEVTGFRYSDSHPPEKDYYNTNFVNEGDLTEDYKHSTFDLSDLLVSDESDETGTFLSSSDSPDGLQSGDTTTSNDDSLVSPFSGKMKKLFQHAKTSGLLESYSLHDKFQKRLVILTSYGRLLVFAKRNTVSTVTNLAYDLAYDINVCQVGTSVKEIKMISSQNNMIVIQTPYKSFLFSSLENTIFSPRDTKPSNITQWFKILKRTIHIANDKKKKYHGKLPEIKMSPRPPSSSESSTPKTPIMTSPTIDKNERFSSTPQLSESKSTSFSKALNKTASGSGTRMFSSYVNSKEKNHKKHVALPLPTSSNLVNGLPSNSSSAILGLGLNNISSSRNSSSTSNYSSSSGKGLLNHGKFGFKNK